jgi:peptide methionine sulfoxide reductase MsrA
MNSRVKNIAVTFCFVFVLFGFSLANILLPNQEFTHSERRRLAKAPDFSWESLFNGGLFEEFDKYTLDQFVFRDAFREIKAMGSYDLFRQKDNNDIYLIDGHIGKMIYPLNEKAVKSAADKLNEVYKRYLQGKKVSYAVIQDKNYFLAKQNGYLSMDYDRMLEILHTNIDNMNYIDLFNSLTIDDYYRTDIHWRQEKLSGVADKLLKGMGNDVRTKEIQYESKELHPFYGSLYGQAALKVEPDTLVYLTNQEIDNYTIYDYEIKDNADVYVPKKFEGMDPYDVFLSGAKPLLNITNPAAGTDKKLILFRDSFGSSIAPLLMAGYSEIILVDLRYAAAEILDRYIDFSEDQDVLFLYNTEILNKGYLFK